jgi:hypothetical protein
MVRTAKESQPVRGTHSLSSTERWLVRTPKESQAARGTHVLSSAEQGIGQDSERKPASEGHSRTVERRARDWLGRRNKASHRRALTVCRAQSEGLVRTAKASQLARGTHILSSAERGTCQDSEREPSSEGHSRTVKHRARD